MASKTMPIPEEITQLVARVLSSEAGVRLGPFASSGAAVHFRQRFYRFRASILRTDPDSEWSQINVSIDADDARCLLFRPADQSLRGIPITDLEPTP